MKNDTFKALQVLIRNGDELEAIKVLVTSAIKKQDTLMHEYLDVTARLRAINKIGGDNEAISCLCDLTNK